MITTIEGFRLIKESAEYAKVGDFTLEKWYDYDEETWQIGIMPNDEYKKLEFIGGQFVVFAYEDKDKPNMIEIFDCGLMPGQYLTAGEKEAIQSCGINVGDKFASIDEVWNKFKNPTTDHIDIKDQLPPGITLENKNMILTVIEFKSHLNKKKLILK